MQEKFSAPDSDQLGQLQSQVNDVKDVMTQNIEKVMERGERLEDLIAQTDDLEAHVSLDFFQGKINFSHICNLLNDSIK